MAPSWRRKRGAVKAVVQSLLSHVGGVLLAGEHMLYTDSN